VADSALVRICESAELAEGGDGVRFSVIANGIEREAFVVRYQSAVVGYLNRCAHAGIELDWIPGRFLDSDRRWLVCAAHGALYNPASGTCAAGPCAGRGALVPVHVVEIDGAIYWRREDEVSSL
jgi:nitrite reductase/ring-hydroxylating ferredoxin subunit